MIKTQFFSTLILILSFGCLAKVCQAQIEENRPQEVDNHESGLEKIVEFDFQKFILNHNKTSVAFQKKKKLRQEDEMRLAYHVFKNEYDPTYRNLNIKPEVENTKKTYPLKKGSKYGIQSHKFEVILEPQYDEILSSVANVLVARDGKNYGALNYRGEVYIPFVY